MLKKLASASPPLICYHPYRGASLTPTGLKAALRIVRQHRLLELYLTEALGFSWDQVHTEADRLEHHISLDLGERIAALLGDPVVDPHGAPIPTAEGRFTPIQETALSALPVGAGGKITRVPDRDPALLRQLELYGLFPGVRVEIVAAGSDGEVLVRVPSGSLHWLDSCHAEMIMTGRDREERVSESLKQRAPGTVS
jgi:DtxR family Mn-dependent transcriptional regulator